MKIALPASIIFVLLAVFIAHDAQTQFLARQTASAERLAELFDRNLTSRILIPAAVKGKKIQLRETIQKAMVQGVIRSTSYGQTVPLARIFNEEGVAVFSLSHEEAGKSGLATANVAAIWKNPRTDSTIVQHRSWFSAFFSKELHPGDFLQSVTAPLDYLAKSRPHGVIEFKRDITDQVVEYLKHLRKTLLAIGASWLLLLGTCFLAMRRE